MLVKRLLSAYIYKDTRDVEVTFLSMARIEMEPCIRRVEDGLVVLVNVIIEVIVTVNSIYDSEGV